MKKQFIILLTIAIEVAAGSRQIEITLCMMLLAIGLGMNALAVFGNGDKMPVRGLAGETPHHRPENELTRYRWFIDRFISPNWLDMSAFSVGDIVIEIGWLIYIVGSVARITHWLMFG